LHAPVRRLHYVLNSPASSAPLPVHPLRPSCLFPDDCALLGVVIRPVALGVPWRKCFFLYFLSEPFSFVAVNPPPGTEFFGDASVRSLSAIMELRQTFLFFPPALLFTFRRSAHLIHTNCLSSQFTRPLPLYKDPSYCYSSFSFAATPSQPIVTPRGGSVPYTLMVTQRRFPWHVFFPGRLFLPQTCPL